MISDKCRKIIVVAGIPRSGSTLIFNAARLILGLKYNSVYSTWIDDFDINVHYRNEITLIKLHSEDDDVRRNADTIILTHRDLRDIVLSMISMGWISISHAYEVAAQARKYHEYWSQFSEIDIAYEDIFSNRTQALRIVAETLEVEITPEQIGLVDNAIPKEGKIFNSSGYDPSSLLHRGHMTNGSVRRWTKELPKEIADGIWLRHGDWLKAQGYQQS